MLNDSLTQCLNDSIAWLGNHRLANIGIATLLTLGIHFRSHVKVGGSIYDRRVGIVGRRVQRSIDFLVRTSRDCAAIYVVSHRISLSRIPSESDAMGALRLSRAGQLFQRRRVYGIADERCLTRGCAG